METKWTPGPWEILRVSKKSGAVKAQINSKDGSWWGLASVWIRLKETVTDDPQGVANANLIAAAPELYEALKDVLRSARKDFPKGEWGEAEFEAAYGEALAALRKARGEL